MEQEGRKKKVVKNIVSQSVFSGIQAVMSFVLRKIFVIYLSKELLGLNGLLTSVIGALSIAELGIGEAINFSLYKPLANDDKEMVKSIMKLYQKLYLIIGFIIVGLGILFLPFLHLVVQESIPMSYVYKIYIIFLLDTFFSYCLAYSRNIISADQRDYIVTYIDSIAQVLITCVQIVILVLTKNYIIYLIVKIVIVVVKNYYLHQKSLKLFPYLKEKNSHPLTKEYLSNLFENVKALFVIKIASFCVVGTDNILLSAFETLASVGIYANYLSLLNIINRAFNTVFDKARASIGNYLETEDMESSYVLFKRLFFVNFILTSCTSIFTFVLINEVITLWLGTDFVWPIGVVAILICNNYSRYILQACEAFRGAAGLYSPKPFVKYLSLMEGIVNLVVSVGFIKIFNMGVYGVFAGTFVSTIVSTIGVPWIVYRFLFKKDLKSFFGLYVKYGLGTLLASAVSYILFITLSGTNHWINLILGGGICVGVTGIIYLILYYRMDECQYFVSLLKKNPKKKK